MLELYNTTDRVRIVPKYNYAGKYTLNPHSCVDIEDFSAKFFEPWRRVGVVVRAKISKASEPVHVVEEELKDVEETKVEDIKVEEESTSVETEDVAEVTESVEDVPTELTEDSDLVKRVYTKEELLDMNVKDLKDLAASLGIEIAEDVRRRAPIADEILKNQ